jgi:hypothetical protein
MGLKKSHETNSRFQIEHFLTKPEADLRYEELCDNVAQLSELKAEIQRNAKFVLTVLCER